jgi:hypothetical protein
MAMNVERETIKLLIPHHITNNKAQDQIQAWLSALVLILVEEPETTDLPCTLYSGRSWKLRMPASSCRGLLWESASQSTIRQGQMRDTHHIHDQLKTRPHEVQVNLFSHAVSSKPLKKQNEPLQEWQTSDILSGKSTRGNHQPPVSLFRTGNRPKVSFAQHH